MMRETDEVAKCMWFLAGTGWVYAHDAEMYRPGPGRWHVGRNGAASVPAAGRCPDIAGVAVFANRADDQARVDWVADMFTAVVLAYLGSIEEWQCLPAARAHPDSFTSSFMVEPARYNDPDSAGLRAKRFVQIAKGTLDWVGVTRIDIKETAHGFLWIVDWQGLGNGEA